MNREISPKPYKLSQNNASSDIFRSYDAASLQYNEKNEKQACLRSRFGDR